MPATRAGKPREEIIHTSPNVDSANCGTTSSTDTAWMRHRTPWRYGLSLAPSARALSGRGGSRMTTAHAAHATSTMAPPRTSAGSTAPPSTSGGTAIAAIAVPRGVHAWRMPIARPRRSFGNHPTTTRPLAAFVDAAPMPATSSAIPRAA